MSKREKITKLVVAVLVNVNGWEREDAERVAHEEEGSELWEEFEEILGDNED